MLTSIRAAVVTLAVLPGLGFAQTKADEPIKTTLCELVKEPERFNGKMVQVRATVQAGFEVSLLRDESCSARIWLAGPGATYTTIGNPQASNSPRITLKKDADYRKMEDYLNKEYSPPKGSWCIGCPLYTVTASVIGRFDHVNKGGLDPKARLLTGFGHLNTYDSQLVLESVADVVAKPIDRSVYLKK